jgi:hypothetical protein
MGEVNSQRKADVCFGSRTTRLRGGGINVAFTSLGDIDAQNEGWDTWKMHPENLPW